MALLGNEDPGEILGVVSFIAAFSAFVFWWNRRKWSSEQWADVWFNVRDFLKVALWIGVVIAGLLLLAYLRDGGSELYDDFDGRRP